MATQDLIVAAYLRILAQRRPEEVSVTDLCDEVGIHRTTFYRYFEGVEDLDARFLTLILGRLLCRRNSDRAQEPPMEGSRPR